MSVYLCAVPVSAETSQLFPHTERPEYELLTQLFET